MIGMHPSQDVVNPKGEDRNVVHPLLLSVKATMGPRREEYQVPPDKATHGLQRRWTGGVVASVGHWSQLTKLSILRLHASLGFLCLSLPLLSGMHCDTLTLSSHCPSHTLTCHLSGVPVLPDPERPAERQGEPS